MIALFPAIAGNVGDPTSCSSYQTIGQHAAASVFLTRDTRPAAPAEYAELKQELQRIGYRLQIVKRFTPTHRAERERQLSRPVDPLRAAAIDALQCLRRLPNRIGAYRVTCIQQLEKALNHFPRAAAVESRQA